MFLMFDEKTEKLAKKQGLEIMFPICQNADLYGQ